MALPKPTTGHLDWTDGSVSKVQNPGASKKLLGWEANERPPFEFMNWNFYVTDLWLKYLESITDEQAVSYDAIVGGPNETHPTLALALAASSNGWRILVVDPEPSLGTSPTVSASDIEIIFRSGAHYTDGGAGIGLQIAGDRCRIENARFVGFTTAGIQVQATANGTIIKTCYFSGNATDVQDLGTLTALVGNVTE
jgi:hypothetical protein